MASSGSRAAQTFLPVVDIDHGVITRKDGTLVSIVMVSATNLALKSPDEQQATMNAYQNFLNTLDFSIEIVVHSRAFDIRPYVQTLEERLAVIPEDLLRMQTAMYIEYIKAISETQNIMQKEFYVAIPYAGTGTQEASAKSGLQSFIDQASGVNEDISEKEFKMKASQLEQRTNVVIGGLSSIGLTVTPLSTQQLVELFYELYNPGDAVAGAANLAKNSGIE